VRDILTSLTAHALHGNTVGVMYMEKRKLIEDIEKRLANYQMKTVGIRFPNADSYIDVSKIGKMYFPPQMQRETIKICDGILLIDANTPEEYQYWKVRYKTNGFGTIPRILIVLYDNKLLVRDTLCAEYVESSISRMRREFYGSFLQVLENPTELNWRKFFATYERRRKVRH
jgi:hypothetical protein